MKTFRQEPLISFTPDDSIRDLQGFNAKTVYEEYNLSPNPVDNFWLITFFLGTDIVQGMIFKENGSGVYHNFTLDVVPGYEDIERFRSGVEWYMMESKGFISIFGFIFKKIKLDTGITKRTKYYFIIIYQKFLNCFS